MMLTDDPPSAIVVKLLRDKGVGGSPIAGTPDTTTNELAWLTDIIGNTEKKDMRGGRANHPGIQIRARSMTQRGAWNKVATIVSALITYQFETVVIGAKSYRFVSFDLTSDPTYMGEEEKEKRHHYAADGTVTLKPL